ncbi:MAG: HDOD domain-containing protein [Candidatus Accumulibacter sp.]|uniref:HDOD domain-containing protein n=1 Tax=Candidatus Accumulibacter cognatus TaxID=2954383 RepID=A0A7D5NDD9_9PROT|nr:HDOD domain-containing protein [Accumulibacter sp.]MBN8519856.1 HDOD domain-containing protein [Accumulibacter sp.]MBO3709996.1 HDOD domain-containing protein [Accumulibacter sp.]QLH51610.1 MAG: HDOD domain-containing protein [Candidatus Accumulibacter cognatus]
MVLEEMTLGDASLITVTFLFTDIEGSTSLWERESVAMRVALQRHNILLSSAIEGHGGYVFKTVGDAFCVTFDDAAEALRAACQIQTSVAAEKWPTRAALRVRVALHTGPAYLSHGDYFGTTVNRVARLLAVTHGGQTLLTSKTETLVRDSLHASSSLHDTGMLRLRDLPHPMHVFQLVHPGLSASLLETGVAPNANKLTGEPLARLRPIDVYEVPTLPTIVLQTLKVMQNPNIDARAVERVMVNDPAISAKILRVANSAFFGFSRRVATIADAVRLLGFINVQGMLISVGAFDAFRTKQLNLVDFWKHSIATATAARFLASRVRCVADEAFMAGLLHDIGKLIFAVQAESVYRQVLELGRGSAMSSLEAERTLFEFTHPEVGEMVAERWDLPAKYIAAIAHHHDPAAAGDERVFCSLIGLADQAAHTALGSHASAGDEAELTALLDELDLGQMQWNDCLLHLQEAQATIAAFVGAIQ